MSAPCFTVEQITKLVRWSQSKIMVLIKKYNIKHWAGNFSGNICYDADEVYKYIINADIPAEKGVVYWSYEKDKNKEA